MNLYLFVIWRPLDSGLNPEDWGSPSFLPDDSLSLQQYEKHIWGSINSTKYVKFQIAKIIKYLLLSFKDFPFRPLESCVI